MRRYCLFLMFGLCLVSCTTSNKPNDDVSAEEVKGSLNEGGEQQASTSEDEVGDEEVFEPTADEPTPPKEESEESQESVAANESSSEDFDDEELEDTAELQEDVSSDELDLEGEEKLNAQEKPVESSPPVAASSNVVPSPSSPRAEVTGLRYQANQNGGTFLVETSSPVSYRTRRNEAENQIVIEMENTFLPERFKRPYIMKEFGGPFAMANGYQDANSSTARIVLQMANLSEPVIEQQGKSLMVVGSGNAASSSKSSMTAKLSPQASSNEESNEEPQGEKERSAEDNQPLGAQSLNEFLTESNRFYGKPISIQVKDADVRDVINFLAEESGANLVISNSVQGTVSLKLREIPWDQALIIVMRSRGLGYVRQGSVLRISTLEELHKETAAAQAVIDSQKNIEPLKVKLYPVSYANVNDLIKNITPFLTRNRGQVVADARTSAVIITDTERTLAQLSRIIQELDIPPTQVMIEGKIVEASENFRRSVGVNWGFSGAATSAGTNSDGQQVTITPSLTSGTPGNAAYLTSGLNIGTIDVLGSLTAALTLAESNGVAKVLSSPRIVTMNNEAAEISQVTQVASTKTTVAADGTRTTEVVREDVKLNLNVTPQISPDGGVILAVELVREFPGAEIAPGVVTDRIKNARKAKTKVLVKNSQTAVIGGIYQSDSLDSETGVPWIKDIPILGRLFKSTTREKTKNELLLFLTPRILNAKDQTGERISESGNVTL